MKMEKLEFGSDFEVEESRFAEAGQMGFVRRNRADADPR